MSITFNPPLDTATVLAVPPSYLDGAELDLCFSAKFDSAEALAAVQRDNVRVELWSNIPVVGRGAGKWGALAFSAETTSVAGDSGDVSASDVQEHTTLRLRFVTHIAARGTQFSYTYRMVQPDGTIKWLGQYGRDGTLLVERADPRIKLTPTLGWSVRSGGETVVENVQDAFEAEVARLNSKLAWSAWTIDRAGRAVFHNTLSNPISSPSPSVVVLLPSTPEDAIAVNHPLILTASKITSFSILPSGQVRAKAASKNKGTLRLRTYDGKGDLRAFVQDLLNGTDTAARLVSVHPESGHALFSSPANVSPAELAFVPVTTVDGSARALVLPRSLAGLLSAGEDDEICMLEPGCSRPTFVSAKTEPLRLPPGAAGERMLVTTAYGLPGSASLPEMSVVLLGPHEKVEAPVFVNAGSASQLPSPPLTPNHLPLELPPSISQVLKTPEEPEESVPVQPSSDVRTTLDGVSERLTHSRSMTTDTDAVASTSFTQTDASTIVSDASTPARMAVPVQEDAPTPAPESESIPLPESDSTPAVYLPFPPTPRALFAHAFSRIRPQDGVRRSLLRTILGGLLRASAVLFGLVAARILGAIGLARVAKELERQVLPERSALGSRMSRVGLRTGAVSPTAPLTRRSSVVAAAPPQPAVEVQSSELPVAEKPEEIAEVQPVPEQPKIAAKATPTPLILPPTETDKPAFSPLQPSPSKPALPSLHFALGAGPRMMLLRPAAPVKPSVILHALAFTLDGVPTVPEISQANDGTFALRITGDTPAHLEIAHAE